MHNTCSCVSLKVSKQNLCKPGKHLNKLKIVSLHIWDELFYCVGGKSFVCGRRFIYLKRISFCSSRAKRGTASCHARWLAHCPTHIWRLMLNVPLVQCDFGALCLWCSVPLLQCDFGALCLWCSVPLLQCDFGAVYLWCSVTLVHRRAFGAVCTRVSWF